MESERTASQEKTLLLKSRICLVISAFALVLALPNGASAAAPVCSDVSITRAAGDITYLAASPSCIGLEAGWDCLNTGGSITIWWSSNQGLGGGGDTPGVYAIPMQCGNFGLGGEASNVFTLTLTLTSSASGDPNAGSSVAVTQLKASPSILRKKKNKKGKKVYSPLSVSFKAGSAEKYLVTVTVPEMKMYNQKCQFPSKENASSDSYCPDLPVLLKKTVKVSASTTKTSFSAAQLAKLAKKYKGKYTVTVSPVDSLVDAYVTTTFKIK